VRKGFLSRMSSTPWGQGKTQHFFSLTPDHVLDAVEQAGFICTGRSQALGSMENRVYEVEVERPQDFKIRSPSDRFVIVKFYRPGRWSREAILDEHAFLRDLEESDIPVIAPLQNNQQDAQGETLYIDKSLGLLFTLFPKMGGRSPDELSHENAERIGRLIARMHSVGSTKKADHRIHLTPQTYGLDNLKWLIDSGTVPMEISSRYKTVVETICTLSEPWFSATASHRIHGDAHLGNLLWGQDGPYWVDFDDMVVGPPVQDLWLMVPGRDEWAQASMRAVLKGYELLRPFDRSSLRLIEVLRALRFVHFSAWIGKRWEDPSFPKGFPQYGTPRYWQEQLRDLEEQLVSIRENPWK
jgi:Ser/Thr protein kinase RdoA (MazF antagonist)